MMYRRESHTLAIHLNINERFVSRGGIYDNSTGSPRKRERETLHHGGDLLSAYSDHDAPLYFRRASRLRFI